jgi:hypothetical protein
VGPSSDGEIKTDIASVLARAILQRRMHTQHDEAGDTDAEAWE